MNLDEQLREALRAHAALAPDGRRLLTGVGRRVRRLDRRRNAAAAGAAGAVAAALVAAVPVALGPDQPPVQVSADTRDRLVRADYDLPTLPFEPGWLPPGFDRQARVTQWSEGLQAAYYNKGNALIVRIQTVPRDFGWKGEDSQTAVNGIPARMRIGTTEAGRRIGLLFERDGLRIEVIGYLELDVSQVRRFAEELRPGRLQASLGFKVTLIPRGFVQSGLTMNAVDQQPKVLCFHASQNVSEEVCFGVGTDATPVPARSEVRTPRLRPRFACVHDSLNSVCVSTNVSEENLSQEDLMRMARGVEL